MSKLSDEDKANIIAHYLNSGDGYKLIAKEFGVNKSTIRSIVLKYKANGSN
ncbi:MAG: transposase, partial [Treponema sp.]|nr:transposase [Treponema sp.]